MWDPMYPAPPVTRILLMASPRRPPAAGRELASQPRRAASDRGTVRYFAAASALS